MGKLSASAGGVLGPAPATASDWDFSVHHLTNLDVLIICCLIVLVPIALLLLWRVRRCWTAWWTVRALGTARYPPRGDGEEAPVDFNGRCPICIVDFEQDEELVVLRCQHMYHAPCLRKQLQEGYKLCGLCRGSVA